MGAKSYLAVGLAAFFLGACQTSSRAPGGSGVEPSIQEKQSRFIERGYEPERSVQMVDDFEVYIKAHGEPEAIARVPVVNKHDKIQDEMITLRYAGYEMRYCAYSPRTLWHAPKSLLMAVLSREGGKYLFGVETGMARDRVQKILGLAESRRSVVDLDNKTGHRVRLSFEGDRLAGIIWDYSGD